MMKADIASGREALVRVWDKLWFKSQIYFAHLIISPYLSTYQAMFPPSPAAKMVELDEYI